MLIELFLQVSENASHTHPNGWTPSLQIDNYHIACKLGSPEI